MLSLGTSETVRTFPYEKLGKNLVGFKITKVQYKIEN